MFRLPSKGTARSTSLLRVSPRLLYLTHVLPSKFKIESPSADILIEKLNNVSFGVNQHSRVGAIFSPGCPCTFGSGSNSLGTTEHLIARPPLKSISSFSRESDTAARQRSRSLRTLSSQSLELSASRCRGGEMTLGYRTQRKPLEKFPPPPNNTPQLVGNISFSWLHCFVCGIVFLPQIKASKICY